MNLLNVFMSDANDLKHHLIKLQGQIDQVIEHQKRMGDDIQLIFADISVFENMILKIIDNSGANVSDWTRDKFH